MKKRILSMVLALALCLGLLPAGALALEEPAALAATAATYSPRRLEAVVLPKKAADDRSFVRTKVRKPGSKFLMNSSFGYRRDNSSYLSRSGDRVNFDILDPGITFMHSSNHFWEGRYGWRFAGNYDEQKTVALNDLILANQLTVWAQAKLTPDVHSHVGDPGSHDKKIDRAQLVVTDHRNGVDVLKLQNGSNDGDGVGKVVEGSGVPRGTHYLGFQVKMSGTDCSCGSSKVSNVYIHFSDNSNPKIAGIYPSDANGGKTEKEYYKAGETVYFTVSFTENIRFADDQLHDIALKLNLIDNAAGQTSTVLDTIEAGLDKLVDNKLIFSYTVPTDTPMDVRVGAVSPTAQSWVSAETPLAILDAQGNVLDNTTFTATSMITDLSGNPMEWVDSVTMTPKTVIDTVAAKIVRVNASASMAGNWKADTDGDWPADIPASAIWAGPGDSISFSVTVDEEVGFWTGTEFSRFSGWGPTARLNLLHGDGSGVSARFAGAEYRMDGVNDGKIATIFHFSAVQINQSMRLDGDYFKVTGLSSPHPMIDPAGNPVSLDFTDFPPQEKFKMDTTAPTVTYRDVLPAEDTEGTNIFYRTVPFTIGDGGGVGVDPAVGAQSAKVAELYNTVTAKCLVNDSPDTPTETEWAGCSEDFKFQCLEPEKTLYLHIRAEKEPGVPYPITAYYVIYAQDSAGNRTNVSVYDSHRVNITTDTTAPEVTGSIGIKARKISASVEATDHSGVAEFKYWWELDGVAQASVDVPAGQRSVYAKTSTGDLTGKAGTATLHVYVKGGDDRVTEKTFGPVTYDFTAQTAKYTVADPETPTRTPTLTIEPPDNTESVDVVTLAFIGIDNGVHNGFAYNTYLLGSGGETAVLTPFSAGNQEASFHAAQRPAGLIDATNGQTIDFSYASGLQSAWDPVTEANGDVEVFLVTGPSDRVDSFRVTVDASVTIEHFTIACGMDRSYDIGATGNFLVADATTVPAKPAQTLTGQTVPITVSPNASASFNFRDLDFSQAKAWLEDTEGNKLEGSEQLLMPPEGTDSYTYDYLISNQFPRERVHCKLHVEIPYIPTMVDGETTAVSKDFWLYMDDEPFDAYYPTKYEQFFGTNLDASNPEDHYFAALGLRREELVTTDETEGVSYASQLVVGLADTPTNAHRYTPVRTLTFAAQRDGNLLPLQVWTGETPPDGFLTGAAKKDGAYVLNVVKGTTDDTDCDENLALRAGENRVYYRVQLPNGTMTDTKVLTVTAMTQAPAAKAEFARTAEGLVSFVVTPNDDYTAQQMDLTGNIVYTREYDVKEIPLDAGRRTLLAYGPDTGYLAEYSTYFLVDSYGNLGLAVADETESYKYYNVAEHYDLVSPTITKDAAWYGETWVNSDSGEYRLTLTLQDPGDGMVSGVDYSSYRISVAYKNTDGEDVVSTFNVPIPAEDPSQDPQYSVTTSYKNGDGPFGLTSVTLSIDNYYRKGQKSVSLTGILPPEARAAGDKVFTYTVADNAGNMGEYSETETLDKDVPEVTFEQFRNGDSSLSSSTYVKLLSPIEEDSMWKEHYNLPFYRTGTYTVQFMDPSGAIGTRDVEFVADPNYSVELSPEEKTVGPVKVTITSTYTGTEGTGNLQGYCLEGDTGSADWSDAIKLDAGTTSFEVELTANDTIYFWQDQGGDGEYGKRKAVRIANIIPRPATPPVDTAQIAWFDGEGNRLDVNGTVEEPVTGPVTALVECDDELTGDTRYVFPCGTAAGAGHDFTVADSFGNEKTLTATLPWDVKAVESEGGEIPADTAAPAYSARLYQKNNNIWSQLTAFDSMLLGVKTDDGAESPQSPANLSKAMVGDHVTHWQVSFSAEDESQTKMVVKLTDAPVTSFDSVSDTGLPEALSVGASSLTWTGEAASPTLYVSLVDSAGNATAPLAVTFPGVYIPGKPTARVAYVQTGFTVRAYLVPVSDMENYTVDNPDGAILDQESGQYYHEFTENGSYTFNFTNTDSGYRGSVTATVDSIDNRAMTVTGVSVVAAGKRHTATVTDGAVTWDRSDVFTNANVAVEIYTSLPISNVGVPNGLGVSFGSNKATVVYLDNFDQTATVTLVGSNGRPVELTLPAITCIDRVAPVVTCKEGTITAGAVTLSGTDKTRLTANFDTDELTGLDGAKIDKYAKAHAYLVAQNGAYDLTFADKAGNVTKVTLTVADLDGKLTLQFSKNADGSDPTDNPGKAWKNAPLQGGQSFYVRFTRAVKASLAGAAAVDCAKGEWHAFTVPTDGGLLTLKATDNDGKTVYTYLRADPADTVPPTIHFDRSTIYAGADMTQAQREEILKGGVTVIGDDNKGFTTDADTAVSWTVAGQYTVTYTAKDAANNTATAKRTLVVLPAGMPTIRINNEPVAPFGTKVLSRRSFEVALQGMSGNLFVSIKPGRLTQAQMKIGANVLLANKVYAGPISHSLGGPGFYTLYIRTQQRGGMLVYLYVTD